ncbi:hypothetical protein HJG60_011778 [Phyllostomus discolor]|uniref:Uncharacterized protein n=1 Tax=Phyllostomus discolor TaxID=89673 RepID=A0A833ZE11_9CHIR|nr:hypothetical protein HJG60_011778 [Phyllostomus discolor]
MRGSVTDHLSSKLQGGRRSPGVTSRGSQRVATPCLCLQDCGNWPSPQVPVGQKTSRVLASAGDRHRPPGLAEMPGEAARSPEHVATQRRGNWTPLGPVREGQGVELSRHQDRCHLPGTWKPVSGVPGTRDTPPGSLELLGSPAGPPRLLGA